MDSVLEVRQRIEWEEFNEDRRRKLGEIGGEGAGWVAELSTEIGDGLYKVGWQGSGRLGDVYWGDG